MASPSTSQSTSTIPSSPPHQTNLSSNSSTTILLRNRENQRASRARRKDYIADLEARVRRYEREGAAATVEVQSAARRVAEENGWLKQLLEDRGVRRGELDEWIDRRRLGAGFGTMADHGPSPITVTAAATVGLGIGFQASQQTAYGNLPAPLVPMHRAVIRDVDVVPRPTVTATTTRKRKFGSNETTLSLNLNLSPRELEAARTLGEIDSPKHYQSHGGAWETTLQSPKASLSGTRESFHDLPTPEDSNGTGSEQEQALYEPSLQSSRFIRENERAHHYRTSSMDTEGMQAAKIRQRDGCYYYYPSSSSPGPSIHHPHPHHDRHPPPPPHTRQADVTLCEEAAHIIASMRGHEDVEAVMPELGCASTTDRKCAVTNMTIFQLGDA